MNDHIWAEEHVAAYVAGGLTALEAERLEAHARECAACTAALAAARRLDGGLSALFAAVRPGPELEDRAVAKLRTAEPQTPVFGRWAVRAVASVAAVLMLGAFGALAGAVMNGGGLPMPGNVKFTRRDNSERARIAGTPGPTDLLVQFSIPDNSGSMAVGDLTNEDPGLQSDLEASLPSFNRYKARAGEPVATPDGAVTGGTRQSHAIDADTTAFAPPAMNFHETYNLRVPGTVQTHNGPLNSNEYGAIRGYGLMANMYSRGETANNKSPQGDPAKWYYNGSVPLFKPGDFKPTFPILAQPEPKKEPAKDPDKAPPPAAAKNPADPPAVDPEPARRVVLRSGDVEFEVPSFDAAHATVSSLVGKIKGAFVSTVNSEKLPNGKVKGSVTVRVPAENLDAFIADLRKELGTTGELKGVRLAAQDVTKQYFDLESRLRAARTMEQRLLQIIKEGKGEIKLLLEAEKELGVWRTKIEEFEGELRFYANRAALSTLTISLTEKEIRAAAGLLEQERVQAGVEVEDVDSAYQQLRKAIEEAKGRVTKSEVKQLSAGQFNATINFEVAPDAGGPLRDRLRQLGRVARLEIDRVTQAEGGTLPTDAKTRRGDTVFLVQLYNLANVTPRETATLQVAVVDVSAAYQALRAAVAKTTGRVLNAQLNEQDRTNVTAQFDFEVRRTDEAAVRAALDAAGEVVSRQVARAPEGENVTDAKVLYKATLLSAARLKPREVTTLGIEVADVDQTAAAFTSYAAEAKGRQADTQFTREPSGKVTAKLAFEVPLAAAAGLVEKFKAAGTVRVSQSVRDPQASEGKFATARIDVTLTNRVGIVADDEGLWQQVRRGLSYSASVLLTSVTWVVFGLCVVLPWALIAWVVYRTVRRRPATIPVPPTPTA